MKDWHFRFGGNEADIIGESEEKRTRIEVKGTTKGFEYFGEKDIKADYLLWFDFEEMLRNGKNNFTLCVLRRSQTNFTAPVKITIAGLRKITDNLQWTSYDIRDLLTTVESVKP